MQGLVQTSGHGEDKDVKSLVVSRLNRIKKEVCVPPIIFNDFDLKFYLVVVNCMYVGDVLSLTVSND